MHSLISFLVLSVVIFQFRGCHCDFKLFCAPKTYIKLKHYVMEIDLYRFI